MQHEVCNDFNVGHYPTLKYGLPDTFKDGSGQKPVEYTNEKSAARIVEWIGEQKGVCVSPPELHSLLPRWPTQTACTAQSACE